MGIPFILKLVAQVKDLDLDLAESIMVEDIFVGLSLTMLAGIEVFWVRGEVVAGFEVGEVALDVAGGAATARGGEADVGRHRYENRWIMRFLMVLQRKHSPNMVLSKLIRDVQQSSRHCTLA